MPKKVTAPVFLLWGEDAFLLREASLQLLSGVHPNEVDAAAWQGGELQDLATPSLFGERRALLVSDCRNLPKEAVAELSAYLAMPDPDAPLILSCTVAERGKVPAALQKLVAPVGEVRQVQVQRKELEGWLVHRATAASVELTGPGARALVETVGEELGQLAASIEQLAGAFPGQRMGPRESTDSSVASASSARGTFATRRSARISRGRSGRSGPWRKVATRP